MNKKEYRENHKELKKSMNRYRKYIWKVIGGTVFACLSAFVFPEYLFPLLKTFLEKYFSSYIAGSITFFTQIICMGASMASAIINGIKAGKAHEKIENAQYEEECMVDSLISENEELNKKVREFKKQNTLTNTESKSVSKTNTTTKTTTNEKTDNKVKKIGSIE